MEGKRKTTLVIEYLLDDTPTHQKTYPLSLLNGIEQVSLQAIYHTINDYFSSLPHLDSRVIITNNGRYCGRLMEEGFDSEVSINTQNEEVRIVLEPIKSFSRLAEEIASVNKVLQELRDYGGHISKNIETITTIGVLYADPLTTEGLLDDLTIKEVGMAGVSYEHEIRKIIRSASVPNLLKHRKKR